MKIFGEICAFTERIRNYRNLLKVSDSFCIMEVF